MLLNASFQYGIRKYCFQIPFSFLFNARIAFAIVVRINYYSVSYTHLDVYKRQVSDRLMILCVQPGIMWTASILSPETSNSTISPVLMFRS